MPGFDLSSLSGKTILVTGGTGSFGNRFVTRILADASPRKVIVFSRDELKQSEMAERYSDGRITYLLGDIRDSARLNVAFHGVDVVVHAAALKQVPALEYNPFEAVKTNVLGAENIISAAIAQGVERVVALSTDKAANPVNLYGATKLCMEKLFVAGNSYSGGKRTRFSVVRYGNVVGSRGSVIPKFLEMRKSGRLSITDERMTRFWITLDQGVDTVYHAMTDMRGGEVYIPRIPSMRLTDLAKAIAPDCAVDIVGVRPGEKIHEALMTDDESARAIVQDGFFLIPPQFNNWDANCRWEGKRTPDGFRYTSDVNDWWLKPEEIRAMAGLPGAVAVSA